MRRPSFTPHCSAPALLALAGCASSPPLDAELAAKSDVVLVVSRAADQGGSKFHVWSAHTDRVLKSPAGVTIAPELRFAMYGWDPDVPPEPSVLYLVYFDEATRQDLRALGWRPMPGAAPAR